MATLHHLTVSAMLHLVKIASWTCLLGVVLSLSYSVTSFVPNTRTSASLRDRHQIPSLSSEPATELISNRSVKLYSSNDEESSISESDQGVLGTGGTMAALITLYSEFTLTQTGCGLPAGPLGLVGLAEGLSYLTVVGILGFSLVTKIKTVSIHG